MVVMIWHTTARVFTLWSHIAKTYSIYITTDTLMAVKQAEPSSRNTLHYCF